MKVIIAGGRDFDNYQYLSNTINNLNITISEIVCGGARGADSLGEIWAKRNGIPVKYFYPDWNRYGKAAGPIRNQEMAEYADFLIAFWDKKSQGTKNMIDTMISCGKHGLVSIYSKINASPF